MTFKTDSTAHREKIADLSDRFAIKNFVLSEITSPPEGQTFGESFIFEGFILVICLKGEALFKVNYMEFRVYTNDIFVLFPRQIFSVAEQSDDLFLETMFVSADYIGELSMPMDFDLLKVMAVQPVQKVADDALTNMLELHSMIAKYHRREENPYRELQTKALLFALFMEIGAVYRSAPTDAGRAPTRQEQLTDDFLQLLLKHYVRERSVVFYADKLCLTPKYLSMTVKKVTGRSILDWINEVVIIEIKKQLKGTDKTVLQISEEMNFPNPSFFGQYFKQYTGMTPMQYKKS